MVDITLKHEGFWETSRQSAGAFASSSRTHSTELESLLEKFAARAWLSFQNEQTRTNTSCHQLNEPDGLRAATARKVSSPRCAKTHFNTW